MVGPRQQLHVRISKKDYEFIFNVAQARDETVASVIRRLIRAQREASERRDSNADQSVRHV